MTCMEHGKSHEEKIQGTWKHSNVFHVLSENGCYIKAKVIALRETCIFFVAFCFPSCFPARVTPSSKAECQQASMYAEPPYNNNKCI